MDRQGWMESFVQEAVPHRGVWYVFLDIQGWAEECLSKNPYYMPAGEMWYGSVDKPKRLTTLALSIYTDHRAAGKHVVLLCGQTRPATMTFVHRPVPHGGMWSVSLDKRS